jgi:hypothetical protein
VNVGETPDQCAAEIPGPCSNETSPADLGEVDAPALRRTIHADQSAALIDGKADVDTRRDGRADTGHAAIGRQPARVYAYA